MLNETDLDAPASVDPPLEPDASRADRALVILSALAVAVGVVLRFLPRSGMWLDEALTANISALPIGDIPGALRRDGHPPLFYLLVNLWGSLGGGSDWWLRALPGLISVLTLPVTYLGARRLAVRADEMSDRPGRLGAHRTGLIAMALMAVMPFGVRYAAELRMYSLVVLLVGVGYLLADDLLTGRKGTDLRGLLPTAAAACLVAAALLWTHYWAMWLLAAVGLLALWHAWKAQRPERRVGARALVVALIGGGILFLPWVPTLLYQSEHTGTPWGALFGPASVVVISLVDFAGARFGAAQMLSYLLAGLIALAALAVIDAGRRIILAGSVSHRVRNELTVLALTMAIAWTVSYATRNTFSSRYAAVVYPLFVLCVAAGLAVLRHRRLTAALLAVILAACTWGAASTTQYERSQTERVAQWVRDDLAGDRTGEAVVIACPDQLGVATQRQLDRLGAEPVDVIPYPAAGDPRFVNWVDYAERNQSSDPAAFLQSVDDRIPDGATVYLVASFGYRTFEGKCGPLVNLLAAGRTAAQPMEADPDRHDEVANLWVFRPEA
jgi:mannosyltransferase